jgi:hypothetical protein
VEVGGALLEDGRVVGGAEAVGEDDGTLSEKFWQPDGVVSFRAEIKKI